MVRDKSEPIVNPFKLTEPQSDDGVTKKRKGRGRVKKCNTKQDEANEKAKEIADQEKKQNEMEVWQVSEGWILTFMQVTDKKLMVEFNS